MAITTDILSERLSSIRRAAQLSMAQVATACNVSSGSVSNYEGGREPTLTYMKDFCIFFGLSLDNFLNEDFEFNTYVNEILTIVKEKGFFEGYRPLSFSQNNIISNSKAKDVNQSQGGSIGSDSAKDVIIKFLKSESESLKRENEHLYSQLERANKTIDMLEGLLKKK
jgi:transcriptional regulator with XRE-family HTH domain